MQRFAIFALALLIVVGLALVAPQEADAQFFFGGLFRPRNNVVVVNNNNGGFGNQSFVNVRSRGFFFPRNDVTVVNNNGFNGGFVNRGFSNRSVVVNRGFNSFGGYGFGNQAFVSRRVFVNNVYAQPVINGGYVSNFGYGGGVLNTCGLGGCGNGVLVVRSRVGCY